MEKTVNMRISPEIYTLSQIASKIEDETFSEWARQQLDREARKTIKRVGLIPYHLLNTTKEPNEILLEDLQGDTETLNKFLNIMNVWRALAWVALGVSFDDAISYEQRAISPKQYAVLKTKKGEE